MTDDVLASLNGVLANLRSAGDVMVKTWIAQNLKPLSGY